MKYSKNTIENLTKSLFKAGGKVKAKNVTVKYQKGGDTDPKPEVGSGPTKSKKEQRQDKRAERKANRVEKRTEKQQKRYNKQNDRPEIVEFTPKTPVFVSSESMYPKLNRGVNKIVKRETVIIPEEKSLTFGQAFAKARREGLKVFEWNGNKYNTNIKIDKDAQGYVYEKDVKGNEFAVKDGKKQPLKKGSVEVGELFGPNTYTYDKKTGTWQNPLDSIEVIDAGLVRSGFRDDNLYPFTSKKQPVKTIRVTPKKKP